MSERYARYQRLQFDRPHPRVLRVTMHNPGRLNSAGFGPERPLHRALIYLPELCAAYHCGLRSQIR